MIPWGSSSITDGLRPQTKAPTPMPYRRLQSQPDEQPQPPAQETTGTPAFQVAPKGEPMRTQDGGGQAGGGHPRPLTVPPLEAPSEDGHAEEDGRGVERVLGVDTPTPVEALATGSAAPWQEEAPADCSSAAVLSVQ